MIGTKRTPFLLTTRKAKADTKTLRFFAGVLVLVILALSLAMTGGTLGKYVHSFLSMETAVVAEFDVTITAPDEYVSNHGEVFYEFYFFSDTDIRGLTFQVTNNGETDVLCRPEVSGDVYYKIFVAQEERAEFVVGIGETVSFWLVVGPDGLDTTLRDADFFIDIQQAERS